MQGFSSYLPPGAGFSRAIEIEAGGEMAAESGRETRLVVIQQTAGAATFGAGAANQRRCEDSFADGDARCHSPQMRIEGEGGGSTGEPRGAGFIESAERRNDAVARLGNDRLRIRWRRCAMRRAGSSEGRLSRAQMTDSSQPAPVAFGIKSCSHLPADSIAAGMGIIGALECGIFVAVAATREPGSGVRLRGRREGRGVDGEIRRRGRLLCDGRAQ